MAQRAPQPEGTAAPAIRTHDQAQEIRFAKLRMAAAVVLGLVLVPVMARYLAEIEWVRYSDNATTQALFPHATAILVLLTAASALLRKVFPRLAFRRREILVCYMSVCIGSHLGGHDMMQILFSSLGHVSHRATPENDYEELFHPHLPTWAVPSEGPGRTAFYEGESSLFEPGNFDAWQAPSVAWGGFTIVLCMVMFSIVNLLRRQWENERLTYPIAQVPLRLTRGEGSIMLQRAFLIGIAIGMLPTILNTIKYFHPAFPGLAVQVRNFTPSQPPWNAIWAFPVCFHPFAFGLAFVVPTDLLFSCWFFYIFTCGVKILSFHWGHRRAGGFPFVEQQATGAHLGLALIVLYNARRHVRFVLREILRPKETRGDEAWSYRVAAAVLVLGLVFLVVFMRAIGISVGNAVIWLALFLSTVLAVSRLRAEYGLPTNELFRKGAEDMMVQTAGVRAFGRSELVGFGLMNWLTRTHRQFPMQVQTDMLEVAKRGEIGVRPFGRLVIVLTVLGVVAAVWALLDVSMQVGVATAKVKGPALWAFGPEPWNRVSGWINNPVPGSYGHAGGMIYGIFFCYLLYRIRLASASWPFHPGGYVMSCTFGLARLWVPLFATWCIKSAVLRYGGHVLYRRCMPFFLGMIVGEYSAGFIRTLIDLAWKIYFPSASGIGGL